MEDREIVWLHGEIKTPLFSSEARVEAGFKVGSAADFLGLTSEESELVEINLALSAVLKQRRQKANLSQHTLAKQIASSQSRVAKMEADDPSVSLDLLIRSLIATGMTREEFADAVAA